MKEGMGGAGAGLPDEAGAVRPAGGHRRTVTSRRRWATAVIAAVAALATHLPVASTVSAASLAWAPAAAMTAPRSGHTATDLPSGKVLIAGGFGTSLLTPILATAELYDPSTDTWSPARPMHTARAQHTATLLGDGRVLVAGGRTNGKHSQVTTKKAEIYDPTTGRWTATPPMNFGRASHAATLLADGRVLVVGGDNSALIGEYELASAEIYDPSANTWTLTGAMAYGRVEHTVTLLANGTVLAVGGYRGFHYDPPASTDSMAPPELYDPATGGWRLAADNAIHRFRHGAVRLTSGLVLLAGGFPGNIFSNVTRPESSAELYDPSGVDPSSGLPGHWVGTGSMFARRAIFPMTLLPTGNVLVEGGEDFHYKALSSAEVWTPRTGQWSHAGDMSTVRILHTATVLSGACGTRCGKVLVVGGTTSNQAGAPGPPMATAELYNPKAPFVGPPGPAPTPTGVLGNTSVPTPGTGAGGGSDPTGLILVAGGLLAVLASRREDDDGSAP